MNLITEPITTSPPYTDDEFEQQNTSEPSFNDDDVNEEIVFSTVTESETASTDSSHSQRRQLTIVWRILAILVALAALMFLVKLVLAHWEVILIILGGLVLIYALGLYLKKRKNNK